MVDDTQQKEYNKALEAEKIAYRLFMREKEGKNIYIRYETPRVQGYYNYYKNKEDYKIQQELERLRNDAAAQMMTTREGVVPITPASSTSSTKPSLPNYLGGLRSSQPSNILFSEPMTTRTTSPIQQQVISGPTQQAITRTGIQESFKGPTPTLNEYLQSQKNSLNQFQPMSSRTNRDFFISPSYNQQTPFLLKTSEAWAGVGKGLLVFQVIGKSQEPITGTLKYLKGAFFDPFKYTSYEKQGYQKEYGFTFDKNTLQSAKIAGYNVGGFDKQQAFTAGANIANQIFSPLDYLNFGPIKEKPTGQDILQLGKERTFNKAGIKYEGQIIQSLPNELVTSVKNELTPGFVQEYEKLAKGSFSSYQSAIDYGTISLKDAQVNYEKDLKVIQSDIDKSFIESASKLYETKYNLISKDIATLSQFEQKIYTPASDIAFEKFKTRTELGVGFGTLTLGILPISTAQLSAGLILGTQTGFNTQKYLGNYNEMTTSEKILGGISLGVQGAVALSYLKSGYKTFDIEQNLIRQTDILGQPAVYKELSRQDLGGNQFRVTGNSIS
jgi:hypothetical protein